MNIFYRILIFILCPFIISVPDLSFSPPTSYLNDYLYLSAVSSLGIPSSQIKYTYPEIGSDFCEYGIYTYEYAELPNLYFSKISDNKDELLDLLDEFERFLGVSEGLYYNKDNDLVQNYFFDRDLISDDDYIYTYIRTPTHITDYFVICYFDSGTNTMYFFRVCG